MSNPSMPQRALTLKGAVLDREDMPPLEPVSLKGHEAINALFEYHLVAQTSEREPGLAPWRIDDKALLGQEISIHVELEGSGTFITGVPGKSGLAGIEAGVREISGVVAEVRQTDADARHLQLELILRPGLWEATLGSHHHAFHDMSVVEVLDAVFAHYPWPVDKRLIETYPAMDRITQWGETDWRFCCRLMQQCGINHHFEHSDGTHRLILSDHNAAFTPFGDKDDGADSPYHRIPIHPHGHRIDREYIHAFKAARRMVSTRWEARDHDYTRPRQEMLAWEGDTRGENTHPRREVYQWRVAGEGAASSSGAAGALWNQPNAGRDPQANGRSADHARWLARVRLEALTQMADRAEGEGHIRGVVPGRTFSLFGHQQPEANAEHLVLSTEISIQAPGQESQAVHVKGQWSVHTRFTTQPTQVMLRPPLTLAKPRVAGPEVGVVVGPQAGQVHTDELGRVKVWQPWQRDQAQDASASPWLRVSHPWAGNQQGAAFLPRVGQEVTVEYYGGDPDLPVVAGSVHNAMNMPGWALPGQHVLSGLRSRELGEGSGNTASGRSNHMLLDDTPGHIQAQIKSDHQHSSLSLGDIYRVEDREGRKDARGEGAELRTDGHGAIRAAKGLLITTQARQVAQGGMKDLAEAIHRLTEALDRQEQLSQTAQVHKVQDDGDQQCVAQAMKRQGEDIRGTGEALGELATAHLLIDSAQGLQTAAAGSTQQVSGEHHAIVAGGHTSFVAGHSHLISAENAIRMFARKDGVRVYAAERDIEVQAQSGSVDIRAKDTIRLKASRIELEASDYVFVNAAGSHSRWGSSGIEHGTAAGWTVHSAMASYVNPKSLPVPALEFPKAVCKECLAQAAKYRAAVGIA